MRRNLARALVAVGLSLFVWQPARAVDGVIEINATLAAAGNVTTGDAPGFPVEINETGSYRLTSNLVVPSGTSGILINASGVQLDLNGFTISSTTTCTGDPLNCTPAAGGIGVEDPIVDSVSVRNGRVTGFGGSGVILGDSGRAEKLQVDNNAYQGIQGGTASTIADSIVRLNGGQGISVGPDSRVVGNVASTNGTVGIAAPQSALVDHNSVNHNGAALGAVGNRGRRYYMSITPVNGASASTQCAKGFHMAAISELYNPSVLTYDREHGFTGAADSDLGQGAPFGYWAWVRSPYSTAGGSTSCNLWTSTNAPGGGTMLLFYPVSNNAWPWLMTTDGCANTHQAWCIED